MRHVYWLGGGSGAGKSTIAGNLAARYGMRLYSSDAAMFDHGRRSGSECHFMRDFAGMDMDERWVNRSPQAMLDTFHWFRGEAFDFIVEDLLGFPSAPAVLVEGFRLLPHLVQPLAAPGQAVWLFPTPEFRRAAFARRDSTREMVGRTSDPTRALANLLERDRLFTEHLREETRRLELLSLEVDFALTESELAQRVSLAWEL